MVYITYQTQINFWAWPSFKRLSNTQTVIFVVIIYIKVLQVEDVQALFIHSIIKLYYILIYIAVVARDF
jgi:hypothetical protein